MLVAVWLAVTIAARMSAEEEARAPWPEGLGSVRDVPRRYRDHNTTAATKTLVEMAKTVDVQLDGTRTWESTPFRKHVREYFMAQLKKPDDSIDAPPSDVESFIRGHQGSLDAIVRFVNDSGPSITWGEPGRFPFDDGYDLTGLLVCDALLKARAGDLRAWDDVHALHWIAHGLWRSVNRNWLAFAIGTSRIATGVARKLPPPLPSWWQEIDAFDSRRAVIATHQAETFLSWQPASRQNGVMAFLFSAWMDADNASFLRRRREAAEALAKMRRCSMDASAFKDDLRTPAWSSYNERAVDPNFLSVPLYDFERDAVQHLFALKEQRPFSSVSRCADGTWSYRDGMLAFSAPIHYDEAWTTIFVPPTMHVTGTLRTAAPSLK